MNRRIAFQSRIPGHPVARWRVLPSLAVVSALGVLGCIAAKADWLQEAYLKASDPQRNAHFGAYQVALTENRAAIGAFFSAGAVYVFRRDGSQWVQEARLARPEQSIGQNIVLSDDTLITGDGGVLYVYVRNGSDWTYQQTLKPSRHDFFGFSLALAGDTLVAGSDDSVYVLVREGDQWKEQAIIEPPYPPPPDEFEGFGYSVSISGDTIVIGSRGDDSSASGVNGDQSDDSLRDSGAAYVYVRNGTTWSQQAYLKASNPDQDDGFGVDVAISGNTIVVGAPYEDSASAGVNGDEADNSCRDSGAAYVFVRTGTTWSQTAYLKSDRPRIDSDLGYSVAASGNTMVVGAPRENGTGVAYIFNGDHSVWSKTVILKASNGQTDDFFADRMAIFGNTVLVSAPAEDSASPGVNGNQLDNSLTAAGAAYAYVFEPKGPELSLAPDPPDGWIIQLRGIAGKSYELRRSSGLTGEWNLIDTKTAPASGVLEFRDTTAPEGGAYYRAVEL